MRIRIDEAQPIHGGAGRRNLKVVAGEIIFSEKRSREEWRRVFIWDGVGITALDITVSVTESGGLWLVNDLVSCGLN